MGAGADYFYGSAEIFNFPHKMELKKKKKKNAFEHDIPANDIGNWYFLIAWFKKEQTEKQKCHKNIQINLVNPQNRFKA